MALPTVKVACSNGHFQESLQNWGDRGTWTAVGSHSGGNTVLTDSNANWVIDEWIGYIVVVDTNESNPTPATIVDNTVNTITVSGDHSGLTAGTDQYRIAGGITATVTANASSSDEIALTSITNKYGSTVNPEINEFKNMKFVPNKLDGTAYTISANTAGTGATTLTIDTSIVVTATSCEIGRGASTTLYPESLNISAEINEPKQLTGLVVNDVVGTNKFEQESDIDNALMLGSTIRVSETTGGKIMFDGLVQDSPTSINSEERLVEFTAYDKSSILDYTLIPSTTIDSNGNLPVYSFHQGTPLIESGAAGYGSDNMFYQTKGFEDFSFVPQPLAYPTSAVRASAGTTDGTWVTQTSGGSTAGAVLEPASGTPFDTDIIKAGCVVINTTTKRVTHIDHAGTNDNNTITCTDATRDASGNPFWTSGDKYVILSKNWQVGAGIESDSDYTTNRGWEILGRTRAILEAPASSASGATDATYDESRIYVGKYDTSDGSTDDVHMGFSGRAWALLIHADKVEFVHYNGYIWDQSEGKFFLNAYNTTPETDRNTRGDLTNSWKTTDADEKGVQWASGSYMIEVFPNRFGGDAPKIFAEDLPDPITDMGVVASEGVVKMNDGDDKFNGFATLYGHQFSYDGDARSESPDKGTTDTSLDITDVVKVASTGLTGSLDTAGTEREKVVSKSKLAGGAGLRFDTSSSLDTGLKINTLNYQAFGDSPIPIHPKRLIEKLCNDSGLLFDLRYDDNNEKMIFKPLSQKSSADISLSAGSVTSLTRERDVSDVYSSMLLQVQTPDQNYFAPENVIQFGCNYSTASVPKNDTQQAGFDSNSYSSGTSVPDYFWDVVHMRGLCPDVKNWNSSTNPENGGSDRSTFTAIWKKGVWRTSGTYEYYDPSNMGNGRKNYGGVFGVPTLSDDGNDTPLHLLTMWFRNGVALDIENFTFKTLFAGDSGINGCTYRVEVSTDVDLTDPLGTGTWQRFNDNSVMMKYTNKKGSYRTGNRRENVVRTDPYLSKTRTLTGCQVKGVKALRIVALSSPFAQQGWWGEGREHLRQSNANYGYKTFGYSDNGDSAGECWDNCDDVRYGGSGGAMWNNNRQDAWGWSIDPSTAGGYVGTGGLMNMEWVEGSAHCKTAFKNAVTNTLYAHSGTTSPTAGGKDTRAGYIQLGNHIGGFEINGVGKKALYIRVTKDQSSKVDVERLAYSPTYKKVAPMGYKTQPVPLDNFSFAEAQGLGQQFLDDKLRRFQARDYSLDGLSPFVNSNDLPYLGQTISIADDTQGSGSAFTGILTQYEFTMDADGARFDFRLEDYDRNKTAQFIQAG